MSVGWHFAHLRQSESEVHWSAGGRRGKATCSLISCCKTAIALQFRAKYMADTSQLGDMFDMVFRPFF